MSNPTSRHRRIGLLIVFTFVAFAQFDALATRRVGGRIGLAWIAIFTCICIAFLVRDVRQGWASPMFGGIAILLLASVGGLSLLKTIHPYSSYTTVLTVRVVDAETGCPIPDATVRVYCHTKDDPDALKGQTDAAGLVQLDRKFIARQCSRDAVKVEAAGYESVTMLLEEYTEQTWDPYRLPLLPLQVQLQKKPPLKN